MTMDSERSLLEDFKQTVPDEFNRDLVEAYAKNLDYDDLEKAFLDQLTKEASHEDET